MAWDCWRWAEDADLFMDLLMQKIFKFLQYITLVWRILFMVWLSEKEDGLSLLWKESSRAKDTQVCASGNLGMDGSKGWLLRIGYLSFRCAQSSQVLAHAKYVQICGRPWYGGWWRWRILRWIYLSTPPMCTKQLSERRHDSIYSTRLPYFTPIRVHRQT